MMGNHRATALSNLNSVNLQSSYRTVRQQTEALCEPLETEDYGLQTAAFASPPKWHLAHTAWFFETLILKPYAKNYREFHPRFGRLFNSYYDTIGEYHPRPERGLLSRPLVKEVYQYRNYVDEHMQKLLDQPNHPERSAIEHRTQLGINHEQQHQELLLTDIKYNFAYNPLKPMYDCLPESPPAKRLHIQWHEYEGGLRSMGYNGTDFCYDNETPRHTVYLKPFRLASRPVTNAEYMEFIRTGGYENPDLWLSDAWSTIQQQEWQAPLYWQQINDQWFYYTLGGMRLVDPHAPVCHVSYFEAAAFARWCDKRLPTEAEWETAAAEQIIDGNFVDSGYLQPIASQNDAPIQQLYGDTWEWTQSPYTPYPGYKQQTGPLGEYNGKFMSSQMVLRGGSCATPQDHIRATYRNFFYPEERWQFSGFRLAEDMS